LTYLRSLLGILTSRNVKGLERLFFDSPVLKAWEKPNDPYLVILNHVKVEDVETEAGENFTDHVNEIEKLIEEGVYGPQSSKLKKPVNNKSLIIKKIGSWDLTTGVLIKNTEVYNQFINNPAIVA
jgi:hypothetical protein